MKMSIFRRSRMIVS